MTDERVTELSRWLESDSYGLGRVQGYAVTVMRELMAEVIRLRAAIYEQEATDD